MADIQGIKESILAGKVGQIAGLVQAALKDGMSPPQIIDQGLIAGMDEVGVRFKNGDMFIPEVLVSAKAMHAGMDILRPLLTREAAKKMGTIVLGTVKGDLHDIGKNLVKMMLEGAGFEVIDLGVDQPVESFIEAVQSKNAQAVGMSALLTTTMGEMGRVIEALKKAGLRNKVKVVVGGAPLTEKFASSIGADGYAPDAGAAVEKLRSILSPR